MQSLSKQEDPEKKLNDPQGERLQAMNKTWTTTSGKRHPFNDRKLSGRLRTVATLLALPISLLSLLPKPVLAASVPLPPDMKHSTVVVASPQAPRSHHGQERAAAQREVIRYEEARRAAQRKRWNPALAQGARSVALT